VLLALPHRKGHHEYREGVAVCSNGFRWWLHVIVFDDEVIVHADEVLATPWLIPPERSTGAAMTEFFTFCEVEESVVEIMRAITKQ